MIKPGMLNWSIFTYKHLDYTRSDTYFFIWNSTWAWDKGGQHEHQFREVCAAYCGPGEERKAEAVNPSRNDC